MSSIKIRLEFAEAQPVERLAALLQVSTEDIAYTALDRLMMLARNADVQKEIVEARNWRKENLPLWADTAGSVHAYEGMPDCEPSKSKYSV